jgi:predicted O-linked N-acetylglucosamine transferase (SPINDLY family)
MESPITSKLQQAIGCFNARDLAGAERLCAEILGAEPRQADALHLLGIARMAGGRPAEAASLIGRALEVAPRDTAMQENLGMAHVALGDFRAAETAFRKALDLGAAHAQLHMRLGMALATQGRMAEAEPALRAAARGAPDDPEVQINLGGVLASLGRPEEALVCFQKAAELRPQHPDAHYNLGTLFAGMGRDEDAMTAFRKALALDPGSADAWNSLGLLHRNRGQLDEGIACFRKAVAVNARHAPAHSNLGDALRAQGGLADAAASCERALAIQPDFTDALINLGNVRIDQQRLDEAQALYERALQLEPRTTEAHRNLGALFRIQGRLRDALACYRSALDLAPDQAAIHAELGAVLRDGGDLEAAIAAYRKAIALDPGPAWTHCELGDTLKVSGQLEQAAAAYRQALAGDPDNARALDGLVQVNQHMCRWDGIEESWQRLRQLISTGTGTGVSPFSVLSFPASAAEQLACARQWARRALAFAPPLLGAAAGSSAPRARDRLRIGYLSWGFHRHATAYLTAELFELHDRTRFEVFAYAYGPDDGSAIRARIRGACEHFIDISADSHVAAARRIREDGVDILVDLTGYTLGARTWILALRPAPIQVNWLGYPGTLGADCVDVLIADPFIVPEGKEGGYAERILRLPDCYQVNDRRREIAEVVPSRADCGLPARGLVLCCFNQAYKILPEMFGLWMRVLRSVPDGVLWLAEANPWATENLRRAAAGHGVAPERLIFARRKPLPEYLVQFRLADLALDTFPYTSHTAASDALWMGCPLATCAGETFASRVAGSILRSAGLPELVTESPAQYEALVTGLATTPEKLQAVRRKLQENRDSCPLFDTPRFVANLERVYEALFNSLEGRNS